MEIEIKLRLTTSDAHARLTSLLSPHHLKTHQQHNLFFDGAASELSSRRAVFRIRFYEDEKDPRCVISLKAKAVLIDGISRVEEDEEEIDLVTGRNCVDDPAKFMDVKCRIVRRAIDEFGIGEKGGFVGLGGFRNVRNVYGWNGLKLEVDETDYGFGVCYEIECETVNPDEAKVKLEEFLKENGVDYSYSVASKFAIFRSGKL